MNVLDALERTPRSDGRPACLQCKSSMIQRDVQGRIVVRCTMLSPNGLVITTNLVHCTRFYPKNEPWLGEYEALAWVWASDDRGDPRFVRLRDLMPGNYPTPSRIGF